ncbi:MAG: SDR family oxidoreductase [Edaphobacter sp.]|uniref:SDR family oxidoreductase n=1 Tax=Edaphobacter sp. TaxID=1934404 RepID=UPI002398D0F7|nr:SDR family oxidoreductase [Edaphobacter sp.]MDE1176669.1 SDR family oxidoreductase [Edaphobacter sp.]
MRIFLTGATGFIGTALVPELISAGHQVLGMTRSDEGARALTAAGAEPHHADLYDLDSIRRGAEDVDAVIHLAFNHDFSKFAENCETDRGVIEAIGSVLAGSNRPLIVTSGTGMGAAKPGQPVTEEDKPSANAHVPRVATEFAADALVEKGLNVSVMRLPQVHDTARQGLVSYVIPITRQKGVSAYVGEGTSRWPACHISDTARLYRLAIEGAQPGLRYNAVGEEGVSMRDIAEAIGRGLNLPTASLTPEEAPAHFGWLAAFASFDLPASSVITRKRFDWNPTGPSLLTDLANMNYSA